MALWELLRAVRRHLVILVIGGMLTVLALGMVHRSPGLYQSQVGVILVPPKGYYVKNPLWGRDYNLIAVGGIVQDMANKNADVAPTASTAVTLAGRGETDGFIVNLPNIGGQWVANYDRPILDVQSVGRTEERAQENMQEALLAIRTSLAKLQDDAGITSDRQITTTMNPEAPVMAYSRGRPSRSMVATGMLGLGLTLTIIFLYDERTSTFKPRIRARGLLKRPAQGTA